MTSDRGSEDQGEDVWIESVVQEQVRILIEMTKSSGVNLRANLVA